MRKIYTRLIQAAGLVGIIALGVAIALYSNGRISDARFAIGVCLSAAGVTLILYSLRP